MSDSVSIRIPSTFAYWSKYKLMLSLYFLINKLCTSPFLFTDDCLCYKFVSLERHLYKCIFKMFQLSGDMPSLILLSNVSQIFFDHTDAICELYSWFANSDIITSRINVDTCAARNLYFRKWKQILKFITQSLFVKIRTYYKIGSYRLCRFGTLVSCRWLASCGCRWC
jgi:hypothetical protein